MQACQHAYDWNVTLNLPPGTWGIGTTAPGNIEFPLIDLGNMALLIQGTFGGHQGDFGATVTTGSSKHYRHKPKAGYNRKRSVDKILSASTRQCYPISFNLGSSQRSIHLR